MAPVVGEPNNLLGWGVRGRQDDALVERAVAGFAAANHLLLDNPSSGRQLYSGPVSSLLCGEKSCS